MTLIEMASCCLADLCSKRPLASVIWIGSLVMHPPPSESPLLRPFLPNNSNTPTVDRAAFHLAPPTFCSDPPKRLPKQYMQHCKAGNGGRGLPTNGSCTALALNHAQGFFHVPLLLFRPSMAFCPQPSEPWNRGTFFEI
jgi:hypothetical protein